MGSAQDHYLDDIIQKQQERIAELENEVNTMIKLLAKARDDNQRLRQFAWHLYSSEIGNRDAFEAQLKAALEGK